jgi:PAS domain S-box-containing protein
VELAKERDQLKIILSSMGDGLIVLDKDLTCVLVNNFSTYIIGGSKEAIIGKKWKSLITTYEGNKEVAFDRWPVVEVLRSGRSRSVSVYDDIYWKNLKNEKIPVEYRITPLHKGDMIDGVIVLVRNAKKEKELDEARNSFVSVASHQLRTPITAIRWYAELLFNGSFGSLTKEQESSARRIYEGAKRMNETIRLLLSLAKIESGTTEIQQGKFDLMSVIQKSIEDLGPRIKEKRLSVSVVPEGSKEVFCFSDQMFLQQIVNNLLSNAIQYTQKEGEIEIGLKDDEKGKILFVVKDNGVGIPPEEKGMIFGKFFRGKEAKRLVPEGSGLGLIFVKRLVDALHGKVWFESPTELKDGKRGGTAFYVEIPSVYDNKKL